MTTETVSSARTRRGSSWGRLPGRHEVHLKGTLPGHSLNVAVWSPPQLQQSGGEVGQQDGTGLLFPLLGQVGFLHL